MKTSFFIRRPGFLATALALAPVVLLAQEAPKLNFKLEHRSAFATPKGVAKENPFWPIGWTPSPDAINPSSVAEVVEVTPNNFVLSSVLLSAQPQLAVINGREYTLGEKVPVSAGAAGSKAMLVAIRDGEAVLRYGSRDIVVALKIR